MIVGLGCDVVEIHRIAAIDRSHTLARMFTETERRQANGRAAMLAGDFAVKEAVAKALGTGFRGFGPADIEVCRDVLGKPYARLYGGAKARMEALGADRLEISLSDTNDHAFAVAVLEREAVPAASQAE